MCTKTLADGLCCGPDCYAMPNKKCGWCGDMYDEDDGDVCLCGVPLCSNHCMTNHQDKECSEDW